MTLRSTILIIIILALTAVTAGAWLFFTTPNTEVQPEYAIAPIKRGNLVSTVSATGTLSPVITVQVGSQVSGTIQHLYADFNSRVKQGDLIAQIDPALFKARLAEAQANYKSAQAARDKAWVGVLDAKRQLERLQKQQRQNMVSESEMDAADFAYKAAVVEHKIKVAAAEQAQAARDREQVNLAYTSIYAPIDGVVISRDVDVGQTVAASLQAPTLFTIAQDLTQMQIETEVDEAFIGKIKEQQPVAFTVFAYQKRKFNGRVQQVRLNPKVEAGVVKYNCIIRMDNSDLALKPGMTATVSIEVERREDVLKVVNSALRFVPDLSQQELKKLRAALKPNEGVIWLADEGDLRPLTVQLGTAGEKEIEIRGENLAEGAQVAVPAKAQDKSRQRRFGLRLF